MKVKMRLGRHPRTDVQVLCGECKSQIAPDATVCKTCHAPVVRRYCPKCSRLVPESTKLCPYCGTSSKVKPRDTSGLSNVAIFVILGLAIAFFFMGGFFPSEKETKSIEPPPPVQLAENATVKAQATSVQANSASTLQVAGSHQPIVRSDEEGTRLNLEAYGFVQQKNYAQAEPILRRAVQSFPKGTTAVAYKYSLYNLGHVLRRSGKAKEAIPYLEECVKLDPQWSKAQTELAVARSEAQVTQISQM